MGGRRDELAMLRQCLTGPGRLVTLTGPGGIGKSWLARRTAAQPGRSFRNGTHLVELGDVRDPTLLACTVAGSMGMRLDAAPGDVTALASLLEDRQMLLVLDRCEHLLPDAARFVAALLQRCPTLRILATSREPLRVAGERVLIAPPLSLPRDPVGADPQTAMGHDAVAFFVDRATAVVPEFRLTEDNAAQVSLLCARLDGNPLALELAAARVGLLSPQAILDRLDHDPYRLLTPGVRATSSQLTSLRASVDASWELCSDKEGALWARLSVFPADVDLDAVEEVCSGEGIDTVEVLDLVDSLLEKSVLRREADPTTVRYTMSETVRAYGAERLGEGRGPLADRHLAWCRGLAEQMEEEWFGPKQSGWARRLGREHANLRAALDWATSDPTRSRDGLRIMAALEPWWVLAGRVTEARHWLAAALRDGAGTADERATALARAAWLAVVQGDLDEAHERLEDVAEMAAALSPVTLWAVTRARGSLAAAHGRTAEADTLLLRSVDLAVGAGRSAQAAQGWLLLGLLRLLAGQQDAAEQVLHRCVALTERAGETHLRGWALGLRALGALDRGQVTPARAAAEEALASAVDVADRGAVALVVDVLAWTVEADGDPVRAAVLLGAAGRRWRGLGQAPASLRPIVDRRQQRVDAVRATLGAREFAQHAARGAALDERGVLRYVRDDVLPGLPTAPVSAPLSSRELAVAELVARGMSNREIAATLVISVRTVQGHVESILRRLRFSSRAQIAAWVAQRHGGDAT